MNIGDWVIPHGTKDIVQIEHIELYEETEVAFTSDRRAYPLEDLSSLHATYEYEKLIG